MSKLQNDKLEPTYKSSVPIQHVALNTYRKRWTIEKSGERGSGRSALEARENDNIFGGFGRWDVSGRGKITIPFLTINS